MDREPPWQALVRDVTGPLMSPLVESYWPAARGIGRSVFA
jgi:hypothetical protein